MARHIRAWRGTVGQTLPGHSLIVCGGYEGCLKCGGVVGYAEQSTLLERSCRQFSSAGGSFRVAKLCKGQLPRAGEKVAQRSPSGELSPQVRYFIPPSDAGSSASAVVAPVCKRPRRGRTLAAKMPGD